MGTMAIPEALRMHPFLEGIGDSNLQKLATLAEEVRFAKDQLIFREGDVSNLFYLLLEGTVSLEVMAHGRTIRIATLGEGDEIGWSSVIAPGRKHFQVRSLTNGRAYALEGPELLAACDQDCRFGYELMRRVLSLVADRLQATRMQLVDLYAAKPGGRP